MTKSATSRPRVALLSLGCAKNLVDSEQVASILEANGAEVVHDPEGARVVIVNTCGFVETAKQESIDTILDVADEMDADGATLIVTGCLSERYGDELADALPEVDAFLGIQPEETARLALRALGLGGGAREGFLRTRRLTPRAWSYLRVTHGCDNRCAYCAIPLIRGPLRSVPMDRLVEDARRLAAEGVRELNVIGQDTSAYGRDTTGEPQLHALLERLCALDDLRWIRVLYMHPAHVYDELIEVMAAEKKICSYVDVPLQHINDRILRRMGRKVTRREIEGLVGRLRGAMPGLVMRTTFIAGFPGETEAEFEELLDFVRKNRFERVGCFAYSEEEDTRAAEMADQVPEEVRQDRADRLMAVQQQIAFEHAESRVGEVTTVLVEEGGAEGVFPSRSRREAPDVDPVIFLNSQRELQPGDFARAEIVAAEGYDCVAVDLEEPEDA